MSFSYTSLVIRPLCWGQGSPLCPCLRPRPPVIVAAQVLKEQKPLSGSGEDHARIGCALFYTDDRQPASDHQSLQNSLTHARSGLSDLLLVRAHLLFLSSQTQPDPVAWMVAPTARIWLSGSLIFVVTFLCLIYCYFLPWIRIVNNSPQISYKFLITLKPILICSFKVAFMVALAYMLLKAKAFIIQHRTPLEPSSISGELPRSNPARFKWHIAKLMNEKCLPVLRYWGGRYSGSPVDLKSWENSLSLLSKNTANILKVSFFIEHHWPPN